MYSLYPVGLLAGILFWYVINLIDNDTKTK
jgi:hypothetical protein